MLAANLASTFKETHSQPSLVETITSPQSVHVTSAHSASITSSHSAPVTSSQTDSGITLLAPDYILSTPVPTIDEVHVAFVSTNLRVLKHVSLLNQLIMT